MIIGFGCNAQVGKDTAADYLINKYPGKAVKVSFADKVKEIAINLFDLSYEQCYGPVAIKEKIDPRYNLTPREIMMDIGSKLREIYAPIWIERAFLDNITNLQEKNYDLFIFSDVRYRNEADKIKKEGGILVRILRDAGGVSVNKEHSSETSLLDYPNFDFVIENNDSFENFYHKIDKILQGVGYGRKERGDFNRI